MKSQMKSFSAPSNSTRTLPNRRGSTGDLVAGVFLVSPAHPDRPAHAPHPTQTLPSRDRKGATIALQPQPVWGQGFGPAAELSLGAERHVNPRSAGHLIAAAFLLLLTATATLPAQTLQQAEALWHAHDYEGAKPVFEALLKAHPENAEYRVRYAQMFYERFNPTDAQKLYAEALKIDPKNADAILGMAQILADEFDSKGERIRSKSARMPIRNSTRRTN